MAEQIKLEAQPRTITGKKVKQLRAQKLVPAIIFGPNLEESVQIQVPADELRTSLRNAGGTSLIQVNVGKQKHNVLVRDVQRDVMRGDVLHVDFLAVAMDVKITAEVPLIITGESELVSSGQVILITRTNSVEVECLPADIPQELTLDISSLVEIGDSLTAADLQAPEGVTILTDPEEVLVRTEVPRVEEAEEEEEGEEIEVDVEDVEVIKKGKEEEGEEF